MRSLLYIPTLAFAALALMASLPLDRAHALSAHDPTVLVAMDSKQHFDLALNDLLIDIPDLPLASAGGPEWVSPNSPAATGYASHSPSRLTADNLPLRALEVAPFRTVSLC